MEAVRIETTLASVFGMATGSKGWPVILGVHGWNRRQGWETWAPLLEPLASGGYRAISLDMPGWGQSTANVPEDLVDGRMPDVLVQLIEALKAAPVFLMGKSWGGGVVLETALRYPQYVAGLILTAPVWPNVASLRQLTIPILLAWSEDDQVIPYEQAALFVETVPDIQLETYARGGHRAVQYNVDDFAPKAIRFLERTR